MFNMNGGMKVVSVIIGAVVILTLLAAVIRPFAGSLNNISDNITTQDFGNATANSIADVFPIVIGIAGLLVFVGYVLKSFGGQGK